MTISEARPKVDLMDLDLFVSNQEDAAFDHLRSEDPVHWNEPSENGPGFWALTRYADVRAGATNAAQLSSADGTQIVDRKVEGKGASSLHNMDDPEHAKLRKISISHLRATKIREWQDVIDRSCALLLDEAEEHGSFDLVDLVSARLPMLVLSQVMGVPERDAPKMVDWTNRLTSSDPDHAVAEGALAEAREEVMSYFDGLTEQRRAEPKNDLVSILANGKKDGVLLTREELAAYYIVLVAAGNETTRHTLSGGVLALHEHPGTWERVLADESLLNPMVEEMLRHVTAVAAMRRTALEDLTIGDKQIARGDKVVLWFNSANRDPEVFEDPHTFRLDRESNDHLTFGWGIHFCLGAHLARAEIRDFFKQARDRRLTFEVTGEAERLRHNIFRGWNSMPVTVTRASR
ncbi:cytochrome P450 [Nocardioides sp. Root151]|uniref:cytochrome P450 n=1 Tax=Nocardioides sp. Root151 TaxID=1736475 RepID=UPI0007032891|nr:cytochrome P450 [Nocardioides sp. Root151]KQZ75684.1 cytochrome [Nocardioides sp. Root151]